MVTKLTLPSKENAVQEKVNEIIDNLGGGVDIDNTTITENASNKLQASGVINPRDGNSIKIWQGSEAQWNQGEPTTWYYWQTSVTAMWTASTLPSSASWWAVTYGDGKFVAVANNSDKSAYSTDGINWTASTLPSSANWQAVTYGDGKFVAVASDSDTSAYSTDGINWTASTLPSSAWWWAVTYGDGKFVAVVAFDSDTSAYSTDGINWTASTLPSSASWWAVTYGDGKFVAVANNSDTSAYFITYTKCYTDAENPTTASIVYSSPETSSALTITSVGTGTITLSDTNTYSYTPSGNQFTYRTIGDAHPDWLCFINGVGVKIGNTIIATNS